MSEIFYPLSSFANNDLTELLSEQKKNNKLFVNYLKEILENDLLIRRWGDPFRGYSL